MLHKYFLSGVSNNYNLKFWSDTANDGEWTIRESSFKELLSEYDINADIDDALGIVLDGYKQCLYLEKSENTRRFWKIVIAVWHSKYDCDCGFEPDRIIRVTTDDFEELVADKYTGKYYNELPMSVWYKFDSSDHRMFYPNAARRLRLL